MYESPVNLIYQEDIERQIIQHKEQAIFDAILKFDVVVDKDELIKAMNYDRNQYSKGYKDGTNDVLDKIRSAIEALNPVDYVSMSSYEGHKGAIDMKNDVLQIIDKYRGEVE